MFVKNRAVVVGKLESTPYTAETLADADFDIAVENIEYSMEVAEFQRKLGDYTLDSYNSVMGKQSITISFSTPMNPGATAATVPKWDKYLQACGFLQTTYTTTGIGWTLNSLRTHIPMTLEVIEIDSGASPSMLVTKASGCVGNVSFVIGDAGEPIQMNFEFKGSLVSVTDRAYANILDLTSPSTVQPVAVLGATVTVGGVSQSISNFEINVGNSVNLESDASKASGINGAYIGSRETTLTLDPIAKLLANDPVYTEWLAGTTGAVAISVASSPALAFSAPVAQYSSVGMGEREEATIFEKTFRLHKNATTGEDSLELLQGSKT